jgi:hypothetical protein
MPLYWIGAGLLAYLFATRKAKAQEMPGSSAPPPPPADQPGSAAPPVTYGEPQVASPFPAGYRRLKDSEVTPALLSSARSIRSSSGFTNLAYGTVIPIDGTTSALVEQHYHQPGGPVKPWGYHHGVTLITKV